MPRPIASPRMNMLRRIPMPLLSIIIGLACGLLVWIVLDQVQPRAIRDVFSQELERRLDQQARETLIRFNNYVEAHTSTARLLANHRHLGDYLEPVYWFVNDTSPTILYYQTPPWLPPSSLWKTLRPSHMLLLDTRSRVREIYNVGKRQIPRQLIDETELYVSAGQGEVIITTLNERPYLLIAEIAEDATGTRMGTLLLVVPIDDQFLNASQQGVSEGDVVIGLLDADEQRFLATSMEQEVAGGDTIEAIRQDFLVTAQSFSAYEGSTLNIQFAALVPRSSVEAIQERVAGIERRQRLVTAVTFVSVFTLVFYLLSGQLNNILRRISRFSRRALGADQPVPERGNQLFVLEDWIRQFIRQVRSARDDMRQQHASEIQESEALTTAIMEAALDSIITIDESGLIIEFNTTAEKTFGYRRGEVIGQDFIAFMLQTQSRPGFIGLLNQVGSPDHKIDKEDVRQEMMAMRMDGSVFPVELAIKPLQLQERTVLTIYLHDISNRKRAEQEIMSLAKFPSESPSPMLRVNRPGAVLYANSSSNPLLDYWGCDRGQTLPLYWRNRVNEVFDSGRNWEAEVNYEGHIYLLLFAPVVELDYVNIYGRDISAVRQAESRAREHQQELVHVCRLSTMGEMATGLAHELNQPLSAIANYANGSNRRLRNDPQATQDILYALEQINNQADRAGEIIKRLRSLVGKQPPVRTVADINEVVREVCSFVEFEARKTEVVIVQELSLEPMQTRIDVVQIEQVILNLIRNALDALQEVSVEQRSLVVRTAIQADDEVIVEVLDSGPGISADVMDKLFDPFFTTKQSGMGMGLVISQTIVEDHNGKIEVGRREAGGTRFAVILPAHEEEQALDEGIDE
ncbi:MAG: ATP-binding protein [Sedimenticola sp.]